MSKKISLRKVLKEQKHLEKDGESGKKTAVKKFAEKKDKADKIAKNRIEDLQLDVIRIQQGIWNSKRRAILIFEGFDAAGKGGGIRKITEVLDPRSYEVHPIGPPTSLEQGTHWMYRFWTKLPAPGKIAIFDRSWYGRVLVERVEELTPRPAWKRAYREIREFERMLTDDGVDLLKFFLGVSRDEQFARFRERLENPYKSWKITMEDIKARKKWDDYVDATDDLLAETHTQNAPWHVFASDDKARAQLAILETVSGSLAHHRDWQEARKENCLTEEEVRAALRTLK